MFCTKFFLITSYGRFYNYELCEYEIYVNTIFITFTIYENYYESLRFGISLWFCSQHLEMIKSQIFDISSFYFLSSKLWKISKLNFDVSNLSIL